MTDKRDHKSPFWAFSLDLYGRAGVPPACLTLQEISGVDVNILLFALYAARAGRVISVAEVAVIAAAVEDWKRCVVVPLRNVRTCLKSPPASFASEAAQSLRNRVKALELESERLQQEALYAQFPVSSLGAAETPGPASRANIAAYEGLLGALFDKPAVAAILSAFDQITEKQS